MARAFVGASLQYLEVAAAVLTAVPFTMACWVNPASTATNESLLSLAKSTDTVHRHDLRINAGGSLSAATNAGSLVIATTTGGTLSTGSWSHACGVWSANNARAVYLNGGSKGTDTGSQTPTGMDRTGIGRLSNSTGQNYLTGTIAEAAIWNVALTDAEVALLALGVSPLLVRPGSLVAYWPLIGRFSPEVDVRGGNSATVTGATAADHYRTFYPCAGLRLGIDGAAAWIRSLSESLALSDARALVCGKGLNESVTFADAKALVCGKGLSESLSLLDTRALTCGKGLSEEVTLADAKALACGKGLSESITLADARSLVGAKALTEIVSLSDVRALTAALALAETLALTDASVRSAAVSLAEALSLSDARSLVAALSFSEVLPLTDARTASLAKALSETLSLFDTRSLALAKALLESLSLADQADLILITAAIICYGGLVEIYKAFGGTLTPTARYGGTVTPAITYGGTVEGCGNG